MARTKGEKNKPKLYTEKDILSAIEAVKSGSSMYAAAKKWKIPRATLFYKINGKYPIGKKKWPPDGFVHR